MPQHIQRSSAAGPPTAWLLLLLAISAAMTNAVDARHLVQEPEVNTPSMALTGTPLSITPERAAELQNQAVAAAAADVAVTVSSITPQAMDPLYQPLLDLHNQYRALHGAGPLSWDDDLAAKAETWAKDCVFKHTPGINYGQNIAASYPPNKSGALKIAMDGWYTKELPLYDFKKPGWTPDAGHFTQVVWKNTTKVGCYATDCSKFAAFGGLSATFVVCNYLPPGNVDAPGYFEANVLPKGSGGGDPPVTPPRGFNPKSVLLPGKIMKGGVASCLQSANGNFRFCVNANRGELQVQARDALTGAWPVSWRNRVVGPADKKPYKATLSTAGNLLVTDKDNKMLFQSNTSNKGTAPYLLVMLDNGKVSIFDAIPKCLWNC